MTNMEELDAMSRELFGKDAIEVALDHQFGPRVYTDPEQERFDRFYNGPFLDHMPWYKRAALRIKRRRSR